MYVHYLLALIYSRFYKVMQTFSNSHWKDAKLRISEAKPNYTARLEIDKEKAIEKERKREFKQARKLLQKRLRGALKTYAKDMRLTTPYNAKWRSVSRLHVNLTQLTPLIGLVYYSSQASHTSNTYSSRSPTPNTFYIEISS